MKNTHDLDDRGRVFEPVSHFAAFRCRALPWWPYAWALVTLFGIVGGFTTLVVTPLDQDFSSGAKMWIGLMCVLAAPGVLFAWTLRPATYGWHAKWFNLEWHVVPRMLQHRRCPACSYSLRVLTPEPDNCIQCPECGAAWKADRVGKRDGSK